MQSCVSHNPARGETIRPLRHEASWSIKSFVDLGLHATNNFFAYNTSCVGCSVRSCLLVVAGFISAIPVMSWLRRFFRGANPYQSQSDAANDLDGQSSPNRHPPSGAPAASRLPHEFQPFIDMPRQKAQLSGLWSFNQWQGVAWLQVLYVVGYWWAMIMAFIILLYGFARSFASAVMALIVAPAFFFLATIFFRVLVEMGMSILLIPHLIASSRAPTTTPERSTDQEAPPTDGTAHESAAHDANRVPTGHDVRDADPAYIGVEERRTDGVSV